MQRPCAILGKEAREGMPSFLLCEAAGPNIPNQHEQQTTLQSKFPMWSTPQPILQPPAASRGHGSLQGHECLHAPCPRETGGLVSVSALRPGGQGSLFFLDSSGYLSSRGDIEQRETMVF
jgi:hypothetical protein